MWKFKIIITFFVAFLFCGFIGFIAVQNRVSNENERTERLILEHSNRLNDVISKQLHKTQALAALVIRGDGTVDNFQKTASVLAVDLPTLANFLLAPDGVVTDVYPLDGNEAVLGLDFFNEAGHAGNLEAILARDTGDLVMAGPFMLRQGIMGLTGRYPVYIDSGAEGMVFWGLVSVSLKFPEALNDTGLSILDNRDISYEIWRINPDTLEEQVIAANSDLRSTNTSYLERLVEIHNAQWYFRIYMTGSWYEYPETWISLLVALSVSLFIAFVMQSKKATEENAARAQDATQAKSRFLAFMSHEMRTPMNSIIGISGIELENEAYPPDVQDAFGRINKSGRTLLGIINDILDLSKVETGKLEIIPVKYDVAGLINDTAQLNVMLIGDKNIKFMVKAAETLPATLLGDDLRIKQILNNILSNSIKYTNEGTVTLTVDFDDNVAPVDTVAEYGYAASSDMDDNKDVVNLIFTVKDTGRGMSGEQLAVLYDEYMMFNRDVDRNTEGTGLGMNITKRLVEVMGGRIEVESEPGAGSAFTVFLPQESVDANPIGKELANDLSDFKYSSRKNMTKQIRENLPDYRVLVVDDFEENLLIIKGFLKPYNLQIDTAASGYEALEKVRAGNTYNIIFMDIMMPGMDGVETLKLLRKEGYMHPVAALTAHVVAGIKDAYIANGFNDFIPKPFDRTELDDIIKKYKSNDQTIDQTNDQTNGQTIDQTGTPLLISRLKEISFLDVDSALKVAGGMEDIYINTVKITARMMPERIENISRHISRDLESFKVEIHGIKSVLANIGAHSLSSNAAQLERAADDFDVSYINKNYPAFRTELVKLSEDLNKVLQLNSAGTGKTGNKTELTKIISKVKTATEDFDSMLALEILSPYIDFKYDTEIDELLGKIVFSMETSDYDSTLDDIAVMEDLLRG